MHTYNCTSKDSDITNLLKEVSKIRNRDAHRVQDAAKNEKLKNIIKKLKELKHPLPNRSPKPIRMA